MDAAEEAGALQLDPAAVAAKLAQYGLVALDICTGAEAEMAELLEQWLQARGEESAAAIEVPDELPKLDPAHQAPRLPPSPGTVAPWPPLELERPSPAFWRGIPVQEPAETPTGRYRLPQRPAAQPG